ncbi:hypothetical protein ACLGBM_07890 [Helicobacter pylori]
MLESLNNINFNNISSNKNIGIEVGFEIQEASWVKSPFKSITGRGSDRGIRTYAVKNAQPYRPRLKAQLSGSGVSGNTDFEANYDKLEILSQTIYPEVFGNALPSQIRAYDEIERIDFIKEACDSLANWMNEERDKRIVASLTNDFTNYLYSPTMSVATIRKAIFLARNGLKEDNSKAFPIKELINKEKLTKEIHNDLISQFDKQAITNALKQEIKNEIKSELDNLLSDSELNSELKQARREIVTETTSKTISALTSKILGVLEGKLNAITESVIKNLDFSFLTAQPKAFYGVINQNLKEMFLKELESEVLKKFIKEAIQNALNEAEKLKALKIAELKALCYLQVTLESHKVQLLQNALMLETEILNHKMKIENEIAYNLKRKELIAEGKLEDESFKQFKFKVI